MLTEKEKAIINIIKKIVKTKLNNEGTGHDWFHSRRVWLLTKKIYSKSKEEKDLFVIEAAALLHDISDWKFNKNKKDNSSSIIFDLLNNYEVSQLQINHIIEIVSNLSFDGAKTKKKCLSIEGQIVQDADRIEALGAIGIARVFAYGGKIGRPIHDPSIKPVKHKSAEEYRSHVGTSINHFYEKLLLLKKQLNTSEAKEIARKRHHILKKYLDDFYKEWEGKI